MAAVVGVGHVVDVVGVGCWVDVVVVGLVEIKELMDGVDEHAGNCDEDKCRHSQGDYISSVAVGIFLGLPGPRREFEPRP